MKIMTAICLCVVVTIFSLVGCSNKENNIKDANNNLAIIKDNPHVNENDTNKEEIVETIKAYFNAMEKHNVEDMKKLFTGKLADLSDGFDFDYVNSVNVNKISEANYSDESIKVYTSYIEEEYGIALENIKIFEVSFKINNDEESFQKFALVKDTEKSKWLICEMFR